MFKPLLTFMISIAVVIFASPAFAASVTYQISVTVPAHAMPAASMAEPEQAITSDVTQITGQQAIQQEQITRNDQTVTVRSVVVL